MKVVVIGGTGKVGNQIDNQLSSSDLDLTFISRREFDTDSRVIVADPLDKKTLKTTIAEIKPNAIVNTIAYNSVDNAEENHSEAMILNAHLPEYLSSISKLNDCHFITYGTDYIFDGQLGMYKEDSLPNPINYYGKSKLTGENMTRVTWEKSTVIRTNIVYGKNDFGHGCFVTWVRDSLQNKKEIKVVEGQSGNPAYIGDIAHITYKAIMQNHYGILHTGSSDYMDRYQMALTIADVYNLDKELIKPISPSTLKQKAKRPERGGLDLFNTSSKMGFEFCRFRDGLEAMKHSEKE